MQLITPTEVVRFSPVNRDYDKAALCDLILQVEETWFHDCLGDPMLDYLTDLLTEIPEGVKPWDKGKTYAEGDIVLHNFCYFKSTEGCNNYQPNEVGGPWEPVEKFTDPCANELWTRYVARILSLKVYSKSILFTTIKSTSAGLVVKEGSTNGERSANSKEIGMTREELLSQIEETVQNMLRWLAKKIKSDTSCTFPKNIPALNCTTGCEKPNSSGRSWGLSNNGNYQCEGY